MTARIAIFLLGLLPLLVQAEAAQRIYYDSLEEAQQAGKRFLALSAETKVHEAARLFFEDEASILKFMDGYTGFVETREKLGELTATVEAGEFTFTDRIRLVGYLQVFEHGYIFTELQFIEQTEGWTLIGTRMKGKSSLSDLLDVIPSRYILPVEPVKPTP